jgi:GNAT superfamily N-acetyltransferase
MNAGWIIRPYRPGDEERIVTLYRLVFREEMTEQHWRWRYRQLGDGHPAIALAECDNGLVGHYAVRPVRMKIGDSVCSAALSLDTMVHPDYRGQGMFVKLAANLYESVARQGIHLVYGFPNENSHHGFVSKLGWIDLCGPVPLFVKLLNLEHVLSKRLPANGLTGLAARLTALGLCVLRPTKSVEVPLGCTLQQVSSFDQRVDRLWEQASGCFSIVAVRDQRYLNWRFAAKPANGYTIFALDQGRDLAGYVVLTSADKFGLCVGFLVDLLTVPDRPEIARYLVSKAAEFLASSGTDLITCLMLPHGPYAEALRANGFLLLPSRFHPQRMYLSVYRNTEVHPEGFIANPRNWHITWADHDDV